MTTTDTAHWTIGLITQATRLRARGLSYAAITVVLSEYHGLTATVENVRYRVRRHGGAPPKPMGNAERNFQRPSSYV